MESAFAIAATAHLPQTYSFLHTGLVSCLIEEGEISAFGI